MSKDDFDGLVSMVPLEDLEAANQRTVDMLNNFASSVWLAVRDYPQGDLYDFLVLESVTFAVCATQGNMIRFTDVRRFFEDCGFDWQTVCWMVHDYHAVLRQKGPLPPHMVKALEESYKCSKRKS
ncbi:hypothetical protein ES708_17426 [subsurface metagenome]